MGSARREPGVTTAYTCSRCGGSGRYSFNLIHGTKCYGCGGTGKQKTKPRPPTPKWAVFGTHRATGAGVRLYNVTGKSEREAIAKAVKAFERASAQWRDTHSMDTARAIKWADMADQQATTWAELKPYADQIARGDLQAVPV